MESIKDFGNRLANLRKGRSITQNQMAEKLCISSQAISGWERNETMPDIDKLLSIAQMFDVSTDFLLGKQEKTTDMHVNKLFDEEKMFTYIKGYSNSKSMKETQVSLLFAREKHKDQKRKEGLPYIIHPLTMACEALALGIEEDNIIATILLHDVCEDCGIEAKDLPVNNDIKKGVEAMTFTIKEGESKENAKLRYYTNIINSKEATITKLLDRCHNVSSMAHAFSKEKLKDYIDETRKYVLPLIKEAKNKYPEFTNIFFVIKYHICSVIDSIELVMNLYEKKCD